MRHGNPWRVKQAVLSGWLVGLAFLTAMPAWASGKAIFSFTDARGVVHFTNVPNGGQYRIWWRPGEGFVQPPSTVQERAASFSTKIQEASRRYGVNSDLIRAVILAESAFDPTAVSRKGAQGLMQIMPETQQDLNLEDPFDPGQNIHGGTRYLKKLLTRYNGDLTLSLAAYNSGMDTVERYGGVPPYPETQEYVRKVKGYFQWFQKQRR